MRCAAIVAVVLSCCVHSLLGAGSQNRTSLVLLWEDDMLEEYPSWIQFHPFNQIDGLFNISVIEKDLTNLTPFDTLQAVCNLASEGAVAFVAVLNCSSLAAVRSVLSDVRVPLISVNTRCAMVEETLYSHVYPPSIPGRDEVLQQVTLEAQWRDVSIIHEAGQMPLVEKIKTALLLRDATIEFFKLQTETLALNVQNMLTDIEQKPDTSKNFLVLCETDCVKELLSQAVLLTEGNQGLYNFKAQWLLVLERQSLDWLPNYVGDLDNVAVVVDTHGLTNHSGVLAKDILSQTYDALRDILSGGNTTFNLTYDVTSCGHRLNIATNLAEELELLIPRGSCYNCSTYEVHSAFWKPGRTRELQEVASWSEQALRAHAPIFPNVLFGLNQRSLTIGSLDWGPFLAESASAPHGYEGLCMEIIVGLQRSLNFSFTIQFPADREWGVKSKDGSWTGLVGQLQRKDVDMTVAPLSIQSSRERVMDFTEFFYLSYTSVLVKMPDPNAGKWKLYLSPFRWNVWLPVGLAIPFGALVIWALTRISPFYPKSLAKTELGLFDNALILIFGIFFTQGSIYLPSAQSGRFFMGFWYMYCLLVIATYSGNLIAFLTVSKAVLPFDSVDSMLGQKSIEFGTLGGSAYLTEFQAATGGTMKRLYDRMEGFNKSNLATFSTNHSYHLDRVLGGGYGYINDKTGFEILMSTHCDVDTIKEEFLPFEYAVGLQNNSYYEKAFSAEIKKMKESGLIHKWKTTWWPRQTFCSRGLVTEAKAVSINDMQGAYYMLGILLLTAGGALLGEALLKTGIAKFKSHRPRTSGSSKANLQDRDSCDGNGSDSRPASTNYDTELSTTASYISDVQCTDYDAPPNGTTKDETDFTSTYTYT